MRAAVYVRARCTNAHMRLCLMCGHEDLHGEARHDRVMVRASYVLQCSVLRAYAGTLHIDAVQLSQCAISETDAVCSGQFSSATPHAIIEEADR